MNKRYLIAAALGVLLSVGTAVSAAGQAQFPSATPAPAAQTSTPTGTSTSNSSGTSTGAATGGDSRSEIYYDFTMGTLYEREYETTNKSEDATQAIEFYKKAYALDSSSGAIGEQLAEMYFVAQRIRDAVVEAQGVIRRDPSNLPARRLLARIYIRSLGDLTNAADQKTTVAQAVAQLQEIVRLDPTDTESSLWLARLDRLTNANDDAERVLRDVLARDSENESAVEQLTQLLLDEGKLEPAVELLQQTLQRAPSATLYDQLGDAYTQMHDSANAEQAYRHAVEMEPDQASHVRGLAQSLFDEGKYPQALEQYQKLVQLEPQEADNYLRLSDIYRQLHQLDKAEEQMLLAKQRAPGNLEVIYDEATIYQAEGRYDDAIRVLSDAVTEAKAQTEFTPTGGARWRFCISCWGSSIATSKIMPRRSTLSEEMAALGPEEDQRGRALIIETLSRGARSSARLRGGQESYCQLIPRTAACTSPRRCCTARTISRIKRRRCCSRCWMTPRTIWRSISIWRRCIGKTGATATPSNRPQSAEKLATQSLGPGDARIPAGRHVRTAEEIRSGRTSRSKACWRSIRAMRRRSTITATCWRSAACGWMRP